jgi:hypothetical protein
MEKPDERPRSYLFTVKLWQEEIGAEQSEWRGKAQLLSSREARYFRGLGQLASLLLSLLPAPETDTKEKT